MRKPDQFDSFEKGKADAARDRGAGLTDLLTLGMASDSSRDPPRDPVLREAYNEGWNAGKGKR